ncbi:MAG: outer membrane protein transport protein [Myxococcota bacterium]|nr:outer membrane protein transport protein [Myxococcota bacterium]
MNRRFAVVPSALALISFALSTHTAHGAGIALDVQSGRGTGMAGAVTAMIDDSSSIFYNPAGIAQGKIFDVQVGDSLILPSFRYTSTQGVSTRNSFEAVPPFQIYESGGVTDSLSIGIGVFTPFGLTIAWPSEWAGKSIVTRAALATYDFNPTAAYRIGPLRIGAGFQAVRATVDLQRKVVTGAAEVSTELGAAAWGAGANVGAQLEAIPQYLSLGIHYRSAVNFNFDGAAHFENVAPEFQTLLRDQRATTSFTTPDVLQMGVASRPVRHLVVDADVVWYGWAKFRSLDIKFPNDPSGMLGRSSSRRKDWNDTVNVHVGAEAALDESWRVRAGVLYDPSPSPAKTLTPDVPDADRLNLAVGGGFVHPSGLRVDLGYQLIFALKKTSTAPELPGDYTGMVHVIGMSVGYRTPGSPHP